jgi:hypothetical protein
LDRRRHQIFTLSFDIQIWGSFVTQHVLLIVTNAAIIGPHNRKTGFFFAEVAHPFEVLDTAGIAVEFASIAGDGRRTMLTTKRIRLRRIFSRARRPSTESEPRDDVPYELEDALRAQDAQYSSTDNWAPESGC